ncbi:MAG TPA: 50S ribosomal protein L10 [Solirubrobacteraceae bacterium]|jgi:large subunit ribosomal protein L10|nr:50S ribosomal protein L10 [Solirubrobacteraceae bacterium]
MNREQKSVAIAEIASQIDESEAIFAVDYRGITVEQIAELRAKLREADAAFKVVKNSLTERAADQVGAEPLKAYLVGPTALTFVHGDIALAAKAVADYAKATQLLPFKGGMMGGEELEVEQIRALSRLPARDVLYGQLVGIVASPVGGLVRSLNALLSGVAIALGQVQEKKESGELPAGEAASEAEAAPAEPQDAPDGEAEAAPEAAAAAEDAAEPEPKGEAAAEPDAETEADDKAEPEAEAPAQEDDKQADVSAEAEGEDAETNPTKED